MGGRRGSVRFARVERLFAVARRNGRRRLTEPETKTILSLAGLCVPQVKVVTSSGEAVRAAQACGFPVVLKVVSPDLPHKSDVGGVQLGLDTARAVRSAYRHIHARVATGCPGARIDGVLVEPQLKGVEVIIGATTDRQFGPVMVFGVGGTAVEVLGDVAFRLIPLAERDAWAMLSEIRAAPLLNGFRGAPTASTRSIVTALLQLSALMARFAGVIQEIEVNPMLVTSDRAVAVDAMAVLSSGDAT